MTIEQIMQTIGCTEAQARDLMVHIEVAPKVQLDTWTKTERTIRLCTSCGKRQWHDGDNCIVCGNA
jgi:hypothetical protein